MAQPDNATIAASDKQLTSDCAVADGRVGSECLPRPAAANHEELVSAITPGILVTICGVQFLFNQAINPDRPSADLL